MTRLPSPCLCLVTNRRRLAPDARTFAAELTALERQIDAAIAAGLDLVQIREHDLSAADLTTFVQRVVARAHGSRTVVVVNDRADVAVAAAASGVHLPERGLDVASVRAWQPEWTIGRSVHDAAGLDRARGADYVVFGAVFVTASTTGAPPKTPAGVAALAAVVAAAREMALPVLAIGGMTPARVPAVMAAGAAGIAAIDAFLPGAAGVAAAVAAFRAAMAQDIC